MGRVLVSDLRGLGDSDDDFASHTPDDTGRDVLALMRQEAGAGPRDAILIGCSMTGASVLYAAAESTRAGGSGMRVRGCVLINPFAWDHAMPLGVPTLLWCLLNRCTGPGFWASYYKSLYKRPGDVGDLDAYTAALQAHIGSSPGRLRALAGQTFSSKRVCEEAIPALAAARLPVLGVYGSKDPDFPSPAQEAKELTDRLGAGPATAAGAVSHARAVLVDGCGHYPHVEDPQAVFAAIREFVGTLAL